MKTLRISRIILAATYVFALAVATNMCAFTPEWPSLWRLGASVFAAMGAIGLCSLIFRNASLFDAFWGLAPMAILPALWYMPEHERANAVRSWTMAALIWGWGLRQTWNWIGAWKGLTVEHWHYRQLRLRTGKLFPFISLLAIHIFPTFFVFAGMLPIWAVLNGGITAPFGWTDALAVLVTLLGVATEWLSGWQLNRFQANPDNQGLVLKKGFWRFTQHPYYVGEVLFWLGLALFTLPDARAFAWTHLGWISILCLFRFLSIPTIERRNRAGQ